ncbi:hypothetical protein NP493_327g03058 [Ridgeia piscesae]|uniref:Uncharacterized protein n=1 Tax=Ridgeia piscesae TaxID=27915 RepID=A0AAD9L457_RIDPI|nr:hypothetical protein NP493_327g03058 [Ridgeia piscesae]
MTPQFSLTQTTRADVYDVYRVFLFPPCRLSNERRIIGHPQVESRELSVNSYEMTCISGGRVIARTTNGERTTGNMTCRKVTGEKVTVEKEGGTRGQEMREVDATGGKTNGRKEVRGDVTKRKSITRTMTGRKETGKKGTTKKGRREKSATREMQNGGATLKQ